MAPRPVKGDHGTWELLDVQDVGEGSPDAEGHPTRIYRIYAANVQDDGTVGVSAFELAMCEAGRTELAKVYGA